VGRVREEKGRRKMKKEAQRREKIQVHEKVEKCQNTSKHSVFQISNVLWLRRVIK
jgi:hypothetical protein